jgi:hypothetical protein
MGRFDGQRSMGARGSRIDAGGGDWINREEGDVDGTSFAQVLT